MNPGNKPIPRAWRPLREAAMPITPALSVCLDVLRWTAAFAVLVGHVRAFAFPPYGSVANPGVLAGAFYWLTGFGHQAVMVFFVLSGFLVGGRAAENIARGRFDSRSYLIDRTARLYPVLLAGLLLTGLLDWAGYRWLADSGVYTASAAHPVGVLDYPAVEHLKVPIFLLNVGMLQGLAGPSFGCNGPLWSLSMEFWYYLLFPLLLLPWSRLPLPRRLGAAALLVAVGVLLARNTSFYTYFLIWLLGVAARTVRLPRLPSWAAFGLLGGTLAASRAAICPGYAGDLLVGLACMLVLVSVGEGGWFPQWGAAGSKRLADFSYSLYCCHFPVAAFGTALFLSPAHASAWPVAGRAAAGLSLAALCLAVSFAVSRITEARTAGIRAWLKRVLPFPDRSVAC
jgi:peptidoglycan/LPS O-acetylase OafA/YrhL